MPTQPTPEQFQTLFEKAPPGPLIMLNLLKFKYRIYGAMMKARIEADGGRIYFNTDTNSLVIGDGDLEWDAVAIVEYASLDNFKEIVSSPEYREMGLHRDAGLEHQLLINCKNPVNLTD
ncbi:MAG: DUF1330 domain-containing protein [Deltaproteobacteria bacterium]|nr:DUF1330 domain-containing protein [Deltaproteobacteria bacterium]